MTITFRLRWFGLILACGAGVFGRRSAAPLVVDGNVSDWGFRVRDNNKSRFNPSNDYDLVGLMTEDSDDHDGDSGYIGPNLGGQKYDAEAMAVAVQGSSLFVAIVTGQRPDNGMKRYSPGDLQILTSNGVFGVELGGGKGGGSGGALQDGALGSTYTLDSEEGHTMVYTSEAVQRAGTVWKNPNWILDPFGELLTTQMQIDDDSTLVGQATMYATRNTVTSQHSIIELEIPLSFFGGAMVQTLVWRPSCGNDELIVGSLTVVPEPSSLALAGVAGVGLLAVARRRRGRR